MCTNSEGRIQQECYAWFHNTFPEYRGLLCYNFANSKNKIDGALNKSKGLQAGRADFTLYFNGKAVFIEMKDDKGKQSTKQKEWEKLVTSHRFEYFVCRGLEDFKTIITEVIQ